MSRCAMLNQLLLVIQIPTSFVLGKSLPNTRLWSTKVVTLLRKNSTVREYECAIMPPA